MLTIDCRHPDVLEFINSKKDRTKVTGANISVMLRNDFMEAVKNDEDYILRFPCDVKGGIYSNTIDLINNKNYYNGDRYINIDENMYIDKSVVRIKTPLTEIKYGKLYEKNGIFFKKVKAKEIYDAIVENAWENAEPGQMFINNHWDYSPDGVYEQYKGVTTNPCGEIFMQPYDACRLMALNLFSFVKNPFTDNAELDTELLYKMAYEQQRLADDLVDLEIEHIDRIISKIQIDPEPIEAKSTELSLWKRIKKVAASGRRTGCGFTALGDALAALGVGYDTDESKQYIESIMKLKMKAELDCTIDLAILRGAFKGSNTNNEFAISQIGTIDYGFNNFYEFILNSFPEQAHRMAKYNRRNISWSTVAPTGTVSLMTQTSSGLEPLFMPYYMRRKKVNPNDKNVRVDFTDQNGDNWQEFPVLHPKFKDWINTNFDKLGMSGFEDLNNLDKDFLQKSFEKSPWYKSTANDIDWVERVKIQGIIQKYTSHSISSTINLPNDVTQKEVSKIYLSSYEEGLKGVTIYRDGSRTGVLVNNDTKDKSTFESHDAPKRPKTLPCEIHKTVSKGKPWLVIVGLLNDKPYEIFCIENTFNIKGNHLAGDLIKQKSSTYTLNIKDVLTISKLTSEMSDEEAAITRLISTALRHGADIQFVVEQLQKTDGDITSFTKAIARVLKKYIKEEDLLARATCQDCGSTNLRMEEGCLKCLDCGSSKCS